jgi:hypothetical protein
MGVEGLVEFLSKPIEVLLVSGLALLGVASIFISNVLVIRNGLKSFSLDRNTVQMFESGDVLG